jgi:hypothetical protein
MQEDLQDRYQLTLPKVLYVARLKE